MSFSFSHQFGQIFVPHLFLVIVFISMVIAAKPFVYTSEKSQLYWIGEAASTDCCWSGCSFSRGKNIVGGCDSNRQWTQKYKQDLKPKLNLFESFFGNKREFSEHSLLECACMSQKGINHFLTAHNKNTQLRVCMCVCTCP